MHAAKNAACLNLAGSALLKSSGFCRACSLRKAFNFTTANLHLLSVMLLFGVRTLARAKPLVANIGVVSTQVVYHPVPVPDYFL